MNYTTATTQQSPALYSLTLRQWRSWLLTAAFVAGNIVVPQLCHAAMPQGGLVWLPIYFFTLIAAYKYGLAVGVLTAIASPLANSALFGMPAAAMLPVILIKSVLLAAAAALMARKCRRVTLLAIAAVVAGYQLLGGAIEALLTGSIAAGLQDWRLGWPGMLSQVLGGYVVLRYLLRR